MLRLLGESPAPLRGFLAARRSDPGAFVQAFFNALESHNIKEGNLGRAIACTRSFKWV